MKDISPETVEKIKKAIKKEQRASLGETERQFISEIVFLVRTFFFVYIGISMRLNGLMFILGGLGLTLALLLVRVPVAMLALDKGVTRNDASITAVIIPKGVAATAVASLVVQAGVPGGATIENATYMLILFCTVATAVLVFLIEKTVVRRLYGLFFSNYLVESNVSPSVSHKSSELPNGKNSGIH